MKFVKPFFTFLAIAAFVSCNTPNRPKVHDIVAGTPTNADTVLYRFMTHKADSLSKPHPVPFVFAR